jgi:hypothetical protein
MIKIAFSEKMSDFAQILALCLARVITIQTIQSSSACLKLDDCMVGLVIIRARHSAKIRAKKGYFTRYLVLKDTISFSVCPSNVIYFDIST